MATVDFDPATLPWTDRSDFRERLDARLAAGELSPGDAAMLRRWHDQGYVALPGAVEHALVDRLLAEYEAAWERRPPIRVLVEGKGVLQFAQAEPRPALSHHHYRLMDFQDVSQTARRIMLHPAIVGPLRLLFDAEPVAMQSLLFEYGSEQHLHQDFPFVQSGILSHLIGCWVALEDVTAENGPLFYYPGSHRLPKYDFGGGSLGYDGRDETRVEGFEAHLLGASREAKLEPATFHARKGDAFLWHGALVHGGSPTVDRDRTRLSLVAHYSTRQAYPRDRRAPDREPRVVRMNGGTLYELAAPGAMERLKGKLEALLRRLAGR